MVEEQPKYLRRTKKAVKKGMKYDLTGSDIIVKVMFKTENLTSSNLKNIKRYFLKSVPLKLKSAMDYDRDIVYPLSYSYIKRPVSITLDSKNKGGRRTVLIRDKSAGMIVQYEYLGLEKHWDKTVKMLKKIVKKMIYGGTLYSKAVSNVRYSVGFTI